MPAVTSFPEPTPAFAAAAAGAARTREKSTPAAAFARAGETVCAGERLDMGRLAREIGVSRATLYRWTGDRERLLADVMWAHTAELLDLCRRDAAGAGYDHLVRLAELFIQRMNSPVLQAFLRHEGESGLRLLTGADSPLRIRLVRELTRIIDGERQAGTYHPPADPDILAEGIVTLTERFWYFGGPGAAAPRPDVACHVIRLLMREE